MWYSRILQITTANTVTAWLFDLQKDLYEDLIDGGIP